MRNDAPDIDLDFDSSRKDEIEQYRQLNQLDKVKMLDQKFISIQQKHMVQIED